MIKLIASSILAVGLLISSIGAYAEDSPRKLTKQEKIARNLELARKFYDGYAKLGERGGRMEGWKADDIAEGAKMHSPWFGEMDLPKADWGATAHDEYVAELAVFPDFGTTREFEPFCDDRGCMTRTFVGGHDSSGVFYDCQEVEVFYTNEYGQITRLDFYLDWITIGPFLTRLSGLMPHETTVERYGEALKKLAAKVKAEKQK